MPLLSPPRRFAHAVAAAFLLAAVRAPSLPLAAAQEAPAPREEQSPVREAPSPTLEAYRSGWHALDRSAAAMGGWERLDALEGLTAWMRGLELNRFQSPSAEPPYDTLPITMAVVVDEEHGRLGADVTVEWPDFTQHVRRVAGQALGVIAFGEEGAGRVDSTLSYGALEPVARRLPHYLLLAARARPAPVRHLGTGALDGRPHELVHVLGVDGEPLTLYVDARTGRIAAHERLVDDWRAGDAAYRMRYLDWTEDGAFPHPRAIEITQGGRLLARATVDSLAPRVAALPELFARHDSVAASGPVAGDPEAPPPTVRTLADGVHLVEELDGRGYNVLFVELGGALVAVDAPLGEAACRRALAAVREVAGDLPVRWVIPTHHHADHAGGVRAFVAEGAAVLTTRGNVGLFTDVVGASRSLAPDPERRLEPRALTIGTVEGGYRVLEAGGRRIHVHDVGPNPHAEEHLVVHVPWADLLFQGDLVRFPEEGIEPARPQARALLRLIEEHGLEDATIVGTHGRAGSVAELRAALEAARGGG